MHGRASPLIGRGLGLRRVALAVTAALCLSLLVGCATPPEDPEERALWEETNDPFEPFNRMIFAINNALDTLILAPIAVTYRDWFPRALQTNVTNLVRNLSLPLTFINSVLQGDMERANIAAERFFTNLLTLGLGDPATQMGKGEHFTEDFGQTLAVWGFTPDTNDTPYLVLPILGPSNVRDGVGTAADVFIDPLFIVGNNEVAFGIARTGVGVLDARARNAEVIDDLKTGSIDYYAAVRSLYRQRRNSEINNGAPPDYDALPSIGFEINEEDNSQAKAGN